MFAVKQDTRIINDEPIETFSREVISANTLEVEAGTNGYKGGDSGHGSRTYIRIEDVGGTDIEINKIHDGCVEITLGGDTELDTIIKAFKFIAKVLEDQASGVHD